MMVILKKIENKEKESFIGLMEGNIMEIENQMKWKEKEYSLG